MNRPRVLFSGECAGNLYGQVAFASSAADEYHVALIALISCFCRGLAENRVGLTKLAVLPLKSLQPLDRITRQACSFAGSRWIVMTCGLTLAGLRPGRTIMPRGWDSVLQSIMRKQLGPMSLWSVVDPWPTSFVKPLPGFPV
ncbi:hypothetical protein [Shinella sp.]|uniref:Uncharacterized protein n=1 Tax=Shinella lacus TaxID=2654216 RepID=A0ABT1R270_9HYPH|nr:hypothetical protein [Shinella lacus]